MRLSFLIFFLTLQLATFSQRLKPLKVALENREEASPFTPSRYGTKLSADSMFTGIPDNIVKYRVKELALEPGNEKLYILYGITKPNKRVVIFDSNFDKDFSKEKGYLFDYDVNYNREKEKFIVDTTSAAEIKLPGAPSIFLKPDIFNCCRRYLDPQDSIWYLAVEPYYHRVGSFEVNNTHFKIAMSGDASPYYIHQQGFYVAPAEKTFATENDNNQRYQLKQSIFIGKQEFSIDSINTFGDTAWVLYKGYNEKPVGIREGLFAKNIRATTLEQDVFDLHQLKGYVLFDFWGTWCNPCIAMIPKLKLLNDKYKSKGLHVVSIASDNKKTFNKLVRMIQEKQMTWTHIYDDQDSSNNICDQYKVECFPTYILMDEEGKIIFRSCGEEDFSKLESLVAEMIR
ncbi:MAG: TlpA family protein disulfide reductase [Bacteroidota bacterium]|nr:TlpA family protein disulfide reductase [Bacteroidota bacterium]